jgi:hypothetical protein
MLDGAALGIQVLADQGHESYVAIRIIGSVPRRLVATILGLILGCQADAWMSDYAMPERAVAPEEQIWSNIMDPPPWRSSSTTSHNLADRRYRNPRLRNPAASSGHRTADLRGCED